MEHLHLQIIFPDFPSKSSFHMFFFPYVPNISHDFPMSFPLKWPFWSRRNPGHEPILAGVSLLAHWATSSSSRDRATGRISHHIYVGMDQYLLIPFLMGWTSIYQLFWCSPGGTRFWHTAICVFYVFRIRMCSFFSLSISRFSFELLNFEYISHQWWVFHESVKRWYKSIHNLLNIYCISHSFICQRQYLKHVPQAEETRHFSGFLQLCWLGF